MKRNLKYAVYFVLFGIFSYTFSLPYMSSIMDSLLSTGKLDDLGVKVNQLLFGSAINFAIYTFILSLIGVSLAHKVGLKWDWIQSLFDRRQRPTLDKKTIKFSIIASTVMCFILIVLQSLFLSFMPEYKEVMEQIKPDLAWWIGITTIFQGGVMEEVMLRLGFMTLLVWLLSKIFARKKDYIPSWVYLSSIIIAAIVFGVLHLGMAELIAGILTFPLVTFVILGNSLGGFLFGYIYWKKGLEYAIIAHMMGDFVLHFLFPLIERLF